MGVNQFNRIGYHEGRVAREHLVERRPQGMEVSAMVDRATRSARLFGRHVGQGPFQLPRTRLERRSGGHRRRHLEVDERQLLPGDIPDDVARVQVAVDDVGVVEGRQDNGKLYGKFQELGKREGA